MSYLASENQLLLETIQDFGAHGQIGTDYFQGH